MWLLIILSISTVKIPVCTFLLVTWPAGAVNLRSVVMSMSVCLSVCLRGYLRNHTRDIYQRVAHVRGSVLLWHVDDRPHSLSAGRVSRMQNAGEV